MVQSGPPAAPPSGCLVRCAGCKVTLTVAAGITEFRCPNCKLPQMLPPELRRQGPGVAQGIDPSKLQLHCVSCKSILNVPHGLDRFTCPQCRAEQAVLPKYMAPFPNGGSIPGLPDVPGQFEEVNEVVVDVETEEDEGGIIGETFTDYRPSKLSIGPPHPDPVVETSSLSAVQPPEPTYNLKIAEEMENSRALSCLQLETIIYASQRHHQHLEDGMRAGFFIGDGAGVGKGRTIAGMIWENWQHGRRKAIWLSVSSDLKYDARRDLDDVGAKCVEVHALNKLPYSKLDSKAVGIKEGVIFSTYSSLIASSEKGRSRLQQLVQWCGPEYDGLLVFDECHKAKNLVPETGGQATRTGEAVLEIQVILQEARVVYCSATGASEPRNMGYMVRLGLWGSGTCFPQFQSFLGALEKRGVGALELVAMDMKARGMYVCRTLSFKGAEFDVVEIPLDPPMMEMYTTATQFWIELRLELMTALASLSEDRHNPRPNLSQLWRLYWASHQRFFRHMCMSAKVPAVVRLAKQALLDGKCVVIGLQSTGEARTEEAVTKYGTELDDFVSGPRELLIKLVEDNYPIPRQPSHMQDEEGTSEYSRKRYSSASGVYFKGRMRKVARSNKSANDDESDTESETESESASEDSDEEYQFCYICNGEDTAKKMLCCSSCGNLVHPACLSPPEIELPEGNWLCPVCKKYTEETKEYNAGLWKRYETAKERKDQILEAIRKLELPINPLDDIINQLGGRDSVAEMTGRRGSMVRGPNGKIGYHPRNTKDVSMEMVNMSEKQHFMDGTKLVAVISEAGSAGVSLQADRRAKNQKRRVHMTFELPWSADRAIQQLGRTHRSNQACAPEYRLLFTNLGGERRFASIVAKRLETLGALTQGDRRAGPSLSAYNYDSPYGKKALSMMYKAIMEQSDPPVLPPNCTAEEPDKIHEFHTNARAALISVGIIRDPLPDTDKPSGRIYDTDMHDVGRFLNRILGIRPDMQNWIFEYFSSILDILVHDARKEGEFDSGIVDIKANFIKLHGSPKTVHVDRMSGASTTLFTLQVDRGMAWEAVKGLLLEQNMKNSVNHADDGFYESRREWLGRRHYLLAIECPGSSPRAFKIFRPASGEALREMTLSELRSKYKKIISQEKASVRWKEEFEISAEQCMHGPKCKVGVSCTIGRRVQEFHILGGLILPVWGTVEKSLSKQVRQSHRRLRVVRLETTSENRRIVGLHIPNPAVNSVLEGLYGERNPDS